jgi:hypothetical protein
MSKKPARSERRNLFRACRKQCRAEKLPHIWKTDSKVKPALVLYVRLNRSQNLPRAMSYAHAAEIAIDRGFRDAK